MSVATRAAIRATRIPVKIVSVTPSSDGLEVTFSGAHEPACFSWFWLRDHGEDEASLDPVTLQRRVDTFSIPADLQAIDIGMDESQDSLQIAWNDGSSTTLSAKLLAGISGTTPLGHELIPDKPAVLWDQHAPLEDLPVVHHDEVMTSDQGLLTWLENIAIYGFSIVEGVPTDDAATEALATRIGPAQETLFGRMWHLSAEQADHGDTAYTTQYLEPHTDGSYYHDAAGLQMFNCQVFDGKGGESIQVDGFAIAERMKSTVPELYATLCETIVPGHYLEPGIHVRAERPTLRLDAQGKLVQVTFNNYDRAPMQLSPEHEKHFFEAYAMFHQHAIDQRNWLKIPLRPGMTLIFDNWRNLHGRMGYVGKRVFYGCYHSKSVFESKLRVLQAAR